MGDERVVMAEAYLMEAVYRSRERQGREAGLREAPGACGLGERAVVELSLSERGAELFGRLWPEPTEDGVEAIRDLTARWVRDQDGYDRDRNHFLKAFRKQHGFDRREYSAETQAAYDAGLSSVNDRVNEELRRAATELSEIDA